MKTTLVIVFYTLSVNIVFSQYFSYQGYRFLIEISASTDIEMIPAYYELVNTTHY